MPLTDAYASVPEYRLWKGFTSADDETAVGVQLAAVSRLLDLKLNQPYGFWKDETPTVRVYGPNEIIAPIVSREGLVIKASSGVNPDFDALTALVEGSDFELTPHNPRADWPFTGIFFPSYTPMATVINAATYRGVLYRYQVTALHGWPAVPPGIKDSTIRLTAILREESSFTIDSGRGGGGIQMLDQIAATSMQARALLRDLYALYNPFPAGIA